jgi:predicted esterase
MDEITPEFMRTRYNQQHIDESIKAVLEVVQKEIKILGKASKVFLGGFS